MRTFQRLCLVTQKWQTWQTKAYVGITWQWVLVKKLDILLKCFLHFDERIIYRNITNAFFILSCANSGMIVKSKKA